MEHEDGSDAHEADPTPSSNHHRDPDPDAAVDRLPPPMFPPGSRRRLRSRAAVKHPEPPDAGAEGSEEEPFPDDPWTRGAADASRDSKRRTSAAWSARGFEDDAFIDPDAPIVRTGPPRTPDDYEDVILRGRSPSEDVVVTGIGDDAHLEGDEPDLSASFDDPYVADLSRALDRLAEAVRSRGEGGLKTVPDMSRFEATLRGYCVGYLAGRRAEE